MRTSVEKERTMKQCALCQEEIKGTLYYFKKEFYCQTCFNVIKEIRKGIKNGVSI